MDRYAIFLDAGYFFSAGAQVIHGRNVPRKQIALKAPDNSVAALFVLAQAQTGGMQLLRAYWYDAAPGSRTSLEQSALAMLPCVKLRLGVLNNVGEQKGVDSLIVTDLIELARNRAIADAVIISGDEDLRVAVQVAQSFGVRVHVLAAGNPKGNVSMSLQMEADSVGSIPKAWFDEHLVITTIPAVVAPTVAVAASAAAPGTSKAIVLTGRSGTVISVDDAATKICDELLAGANQTVLVALKTHFATSNTVPVDYDRRLVARTAAALGGRRLTGDETRHIRGIFVKIVRAK